MLAQIEQDTGNAVMDHLTQFGVHSDEAFQSFIQSDSATLGEAREALHNLMMYGTMTGFEKLAERFGEQVAYHDPEAATEALNEVGWAWRYSDEGNLIVDTPRYGEMTWEQGVKAGAIKFLK